MGLLNEKNNHHQKEIDDVSSEQKMLFEIVGYLETHIDELETIMYTQKHDIARLKRNVVTLDQNVCCCCDHLLSSEPHGLTDKEGLEYSMDSEYQEVLMELANHPWSAYSPPPPVTPPSNIDEFGHADSPVPGGHATSFSCDITFDVVPDSEEEDIPPPLENMVPIPIAVGHGVCRIKPGEIDFIPFQVSGQRCKCSGGVPISTYHPYCSIKGQCHCNPGGWCNKSDCHGG